MRTLPLSPALGTEAIDIDLRQPVADADFESLHAKLVDTTVLVIRDQRLAPDDLVRFTKRFGDILVYTRAANAHHTHPEVLVLSNILRDGKPIGLQRAGDTGIPTATSSRCLQRSRCSTPSSCRR